MPNPTVSVVGLGKVGVPMVVAFASRGYEVIGVDTNQQLADDIERGVLSIREAEAQERLTKNKNRIRIVTDHADAVANSAMTFLIVPTPSRSDGRFDTDYLESAADEVGKALRDKSEWHTVVVTSTVLPGNTDDVIRPALERASGKKCGEDFGLCYSPLFIALGEVVRNILHPDFVLIGEFDQRSGDQLSNFYSRVVENDAPRARMSLHNAELTKIAVNTFATMKLSYANMLAEICERLPGGDVTQVTQALGMDRRIGSRFLHGGPAYGGPCFPRDNAAFAAMARDLDVDPNLAVATDKINRRQAKRLLDTIRSLLPEGGKVGILGLGYKPNTDVIEESASMNLVRLLAETDIPYLAYDPLAMRQAEGPLFAPEQLAESTGEVLAQANLSIIMTADAEFKNISSSDFELLDGTKGPRILLDCWNLYKPNHFSSNVEYLQVGKAIERPAAV